MMQDHKAPQGNTFQEGVKQEDREEAILMGTGLPVHGGIPWKTDAYLEAQEVLTGVPMGPIIPEVDALEERANCAATTKKGFECKGYAVADSTFCMVHNA